MNGDFLMQKLQAVVWRHQWLGWWRKLAICWAIVAVTAGGVLLFQRQTGWASPHVLPILAATAMAAVLGLAIHHFTRPPNVRWIAQQIEARHPELDGVLLTAVQHSAGGASGNSYLQYRVLQEATARSQDSDWRRIVPGSHFAIAQIVHLGALACAVIALASLWVRPIHGTAPAWLGADGIAVTPGDTSIERGDSLVVLARFGQTLPPAVTLVVRESGSAPRAIPLVKSLADPVFGGSVPEVAKDLTYQLEYRGQRTREFKVSVYEHPRLVRSDVDLTFPGYTKLAPKHIEDTRRVSAVQGTKLDFALQLNKPVKSAKLVSRDGKKTTVPLQVSPDAATANLANFVPEKSQAYDLQLVDADGRANKVASPFFIDVQPNRAPEIRLASPRGDVRPSALEEVTFEGNVWDDFGASAYGLAYSVNGAEPRSIELGRELGPKEKRTFNHLLKLEDIGVKPDDLVAWHAWAEDVGPDGKTRRTNGDLYFAEVRPFDEIFRESQDMGGEGESQGGQGNQARKLTDLQKQIINATWRLQRDGATPKYADDVKVVTDSQQQALAQAEEAQAEARSPREQGMWKSATNEMEKAIDRLKDAAKTPGPLAQALPAEQAAYQALLKLQARETAVTRRNRQKGGGGGGQQANQRQIDQLDLQQSENRYETRRQAKAPENQERREQLAVMNRLQELARRQQDLNERMKELQTALQEARTEQQREDIKRRLKRLEEEQQQMLADVDELRQRMDRPENQSRMAEERQQLEQTREDVQKAAEAAGEGSVAQALASGTRAQRQLQQLRDDMRKENSSQFAEDMREMRGEARELSRRQEELGQQIENLARAPTQRRTLTDGGASKEVIDQLEQQRERMNKLMDRATQVSEQAENTEPLLSRHLYDSIRKVSQDDANSVKQARNDLLSSGQLSFDLRDRLQKAEEREGGGKALEVTREILRSGAVSEAGRAGERARAELDELKRGVERAAESVLGDDLEQLKLAQSELDAVTDQLQRELAQADGTQPGARGQNQRGGGSQSAEQSEAERRAAEMRDQVAEMGQAGRGRPGDPRQSDGQRQRGGQPGDRSGQQAGAGQEPGQRGGQQPGEAQEGQPQGGQQPGEQGQRMAGNSQGQQPGQSGQSGQEAQQGSEGQQGGQSQGQQAQSGQGGGSERMAGGRGGRDQRGGDRRGLSVEDLLNRGTFRGGDNRGGGRGGWDGDWSGAWNPGIWDGPLTGEDFARWSERLRDVEELLDTPEQRNAIAAARERARLLRRDFKQDLKKPDWTVVKLEILKPLVEVRNRVADEVARRDSKDPLAPIDRDPVPNRYAESVRRYYEELGKDK